MVRWLLLGAVAANLLVATWFGWQTSSRAASGFSGQPVAGPGLVLLSEVEVATRPGACLLVGPYPNRQAAQQALASAAERGGVARVLARDFNAGEDYSVYIPVNESASRAARIPQELAAAGIDSYIFGDGPLAGHVSVGLHSSLAAAEARQQSLLALGYDAEIRPMPRPMRDYWLALDTAFGRSTQSWTSMFAGAPRMVKKESPCETVASSGQFP